VSRFSNSGFDFVLITDSPNIYAPGWNVKVFPKFSAENSGLYSNKYYKLQPHFCLNEYKINVYLDGNRHITNFEHLKSLIEKVTLDPDLDALFFSSSDEESFIEKIDYLIKHSPESSQEVLKEQKELFLSASDQYLMIDSSVIIRKTHSKPMQKMLDYWLGQLNRFSLNDRISFSSTISKTGFGRFMILDRSVLNDTINFTLKHKQ